jgi:hypothetical protein
MPARALVSNDWAVGKVLRVGTVSAYGWHGICQMVAGSYDAPRFGGAVMANERYQALRIVLQIMAILFVVGGLLMIFGNKVVIMRLFMHPPELEVSTLLLFTLKEMGSVALMLAALLWFAARDPGRNLAIIDGFIVGFCVLAATPLISLATLPIAEIYPGRLVWGRSLIRLALAALFYFLRPRNVDAEAGKM